MTQKQFTDSEWNPAAELGTLFSADSDDLDLEALNALLAKDTPSDDAFGIKELLSEPPARTQPEPAKAPKKKEKAPAAARRQSSIASFGNKKLLITGIAAAVLVLLCVAGVLIHAAMDPYDNRILPGTTMGGIDVGGMTRLEAYRALKDATSETFSKQPMEVRLPDGVITLPPENTKVKLNVWSAANAAFDLGRSGTDAENQAAAQGTGTQVDLFPHLKLDTDYIRTQLEAYAAEHNVAHTELSYRLEGTEPALKEGSFDESAPVQTLQLTLGTPLEELDVDAVLAEIQDAYGHNRFLVTIDTIPYQSEPAAPDLEAIAQELYIAPVNTSLDMQTYQQIPGSYGYQLDMDTAERLLKDAQYGETISIPMTYVTPEILGDAAYFRDELGYCETKHTNNENRNTNLTLACAALDGVILQPGEEFSYNDTVGERTKEKGYKPAAAYSGTRTVDSIGGGVCQVSSTLYNAALVADMEIVFRINHGFRSGYIGVGLDATVNWGGPDFQFRNNSHFPVMIKAEVSDGFVKVKLIGIDEKDYYIKMTSGYSEDESYVYSWSYKNKYDKETDELISKEKEAYSCYMK